VAAVLTATPLLLRALRQGQTPASRMPIYQRWILIGLLAVVIAVVVDMFVITT
jgi:hypothetical protein